jgi:tetratricopeptide (TPR) repeat protein
MMIFYFPQIARKLIVFFLILPSMILAQHEIRYDSLKAALPNSTGVERIDILNELGHMEIDTSMEVVINYLNESILLAEKLKENKKLAFAYRVRGMKFNATGKHGNALADFKKALEIQKAFDDKKEKGIILTNMGVVYRYLNQFENAIKVYTESSEINDQLKDTLANAIVFHNIGNLYNSLANKEEAIKYYKKAHEISLKTNHHYGMTITGLAIAQMHRDMEDFESSLHYFNEVKSLLDSIKTNTLHASYYSGFGLWCFKMKKYEEAVQNYKLAESFALNDNRFHKIISIYLNMGLLYTETENYIKAEYYLQKALNISEEGEFVEKVGDSHLYLSQLYYKTPDYKKAYDHLNKHLTISDSLFQVDLEAQISEIRTKYETEKKEKENLKLRSENEIKNLSLSKKNIIIYSLGIGVLIASGLIILLFVQYRKKNKAYQVLVTQNIELARKDLREREIKFADEIISDEAISKKSTEKVEEDEMYIELFSKVKKYFIEEKPYLDSKLSLDDLSKALNTNRSYLSKTINIYLHKSFYELLNEYRVKEARLLFMDGHYDHISIEGIGQMVGFASRSTFYNYFNKQFGITPSYFRNNIKQKAQTLFSSTIS